MRSMDRPPSARCFVLLSLLVLTGLLSAPAVARAESFLEFLRDTGPAMPVVPAVEAPAAAVPRGQRGDNKIVLPCGGSGQRCCSAGQCNLGLICNSNGVCRPPCGGPGLPCCSGGTCGSGLACNSNNICRTCGGSGDICCSGNSCNNGLVCNGGFCGTPSCGGAYESCCNGQCDPFLTCTISGCLPCGLRYRPCCDGFQCDEGICSYASNTCL